MATETQCQRDARLERMRALQSEILATESQQQREARLERVSALQSERLAAETQQQREARLERMSALQTERIASETPQLREARLLNDRQAHRNQRALHSVQSRMMKFHEHISTLQIASCSICSKGFPGLKVNPQSEHCILINFVH